MPQFLDTNILLYSISRNPAESHKRERAIVLLDDNSGALSVQVLQQFYVQATRPSRTDAIPHELAAGLIESWTRFPVQDMTLDVLRRVLRIMPVVRFLVLGQPRWRFSRAAIAPTGM